MTPEQIAELKQQTAQITEVFGDDWEIRYDHDEDVVEVITDFEVPSIFGFATVFTTEQTAMEGNPLAVAEFLAGSVKAVPALLAELEQAKRGGMELGKTVEFLAELIKSAFMRGADDPIGALNMLGDHLAEVFESEGGLSPDEFSRVQRTLDARESEEEARLRKGDERRRADVSRSLADIAHAQRPLTEHERAFQGGI